MCALLLTRRSTVQKDNMVGQMLECISAAAVIVMGQLTNLYASFVCHQQIRHLQVPNKEIGEDNGPTTWFNPPPPSLQ